jgi:hypothetical protein
MRIHDGGEDESGYHFQKTKQASVVHHGGWLLFLGTGKVQGDR